MAEVQVPQVGPLRCHQHVHLEPSLRLERSAGLRPPQARSRSEFFALRDPATVQGSVPSQAGMALLREVHAEQAAEQVDYVELRVSPRRFMPPEGGSLSQFLMSFGDAVMTMNNPVLRLILVVNRNWTAGLLEELEQELSSGLPPGWVGIDLAGDEVSYPDHRRFSRVFQLAELRGLGRAVHAGEFGDSGSVWSALDILGARRIGHGLPVGKSKALQARLLRDDVLVEVCLTSNSRLGAASLGRHPLVAIHEAGIPFSVNVDMPVLLQATLDSEEALAARILSWSDSDVKTARERAGAYCFIRE
jgi:adenosine deaminase